MSDEIRLEKSSEASAADLDRLAAWYDEYAPRVFGIAVKILRNASDAEEIVQEVFLQAWLQRVRYDVRRGAPAAWLATMARTRAIDRLRASRAQRDREKTDAADRAHIVETSEVMNLESAAQIWHFVAGLPTFERVALELAFSDGHTHVEIARILRRPLGTVKSRIRHALQKVREAIESGEAEVAGAKSTPENPFTNTLTDYLGRRPSSAQPGPSLDGVRVLVVDDDGDTCEIVSTVLEIAGARVDHAISAPAGLARLAVRWSDVLIADLRMPESDGFSLMRRARRLATALERPLRAAALTGLVHERDRAAAIRAGFDTHLSKPIEPYTLVRVVADLAPSGR